jgi:ABC-2 type transport system ATP-binding protein
MPDDALVTGNLVKKYKSGAVAVNNLSLEIKKGDFFGLLGPNGAGESATINSPQEFNVDFFCKVEKVLDYVGGYYGVPKALREKRVEELLEQFNLKEHREKAFRELSAGLKRRVVLARALVHDPELVVFDEPTSGVDVELRHELWRYMRELNERGKTVILTSHYLEEVEMLAKNIGIINRGKLVAKGSKDEFVRDGRCLEEVYLKITKGEVW